MGREFEAEKKKRPSTRFFVTEPTHFTGYCYKIPGYEFAKHGLNVQK
jgi:hypothetical protein